MFRVAPEASGILGRRESRASGGLVVLVTHGSVVNPYHLSWPTRVNRRCAPRIRVTGREAYSASVESQLRCERDAPKSGPSARQDQVYTASRRSTARRGAQRPEAHTDNESHTKQGKRKTEPKADSGHETHNGAKRQSRGKTKDSGVRHIAPRTSGSASETLTGRE